MGHIILAGGKNKMNIPSGIPQGYTRLLYIESTGTQYIDTGIDYGPTNYNKIRLVVDGSFTSTSAQYSVHGCGNGAAACYVGINYDKLSYGNGQGPNVVSAVYTAGTRAVWDVDMSTAKYHVTGFDEISFSLLTPTTTLNMYLFACDPGIYTAARIYSCQIYNSDTLIRNFIPCINVEGSVGLYDTVDGKFYGNAGTGAFTGSEVE